MQDAGTDRQLSTLTNPNRTIKQIYTDLKILQISMVFVILLLLDFLKQTLFDYKFVYLINHYY